MDPDPAPPESLKLLQKCRHCARALERRLMASMKAGELPTIRRWSSKIAENLQD
jgi:hypothetical protein